VEVLAETVSLIAIVVAVQALARRLGLLAPILLVGVGVAISYLPHVPSIDLDPEFVLIGIVPPLLFVAALETSVPAVRYNLRPILLLAVGLVLFTATAVGLVVYALVPGVPLAICLALGAVVAPPDAIAATAVARRIGLPRRMVTILEGESLLNDATALVLFRIAVFAAVGSAIDALDITREVVVSTAGGLLIGGGCAVVIAYLHKRTTDPLIDNSISLLTPFLVVLAAEAVHASGIVAVVVAGLYLGHRLPILMSAASRLQMGAFWKIANYVLEGLVFLLVGLQLRGVLARLDTPFAQIVGITAAVLGTVIVTRFVWMYPATYLPRRIPAVRRRDPPPPWTVPTVIAWAGMRGVITLATALALPLTLAGDATYPRDLFVWLAFAVILGTLGLQGTTLPAFARWLRPPPDDPMQDVLAEAEVQFAASRAARERLDESADSAPPDVVERLRRLTESRSNTAWERLGGDAETPSGAYVRLRREMLLAEREVFRRARDEGRIAEEVLVKAQRDMDLEEAALERGGQ
jgi:monovalent cation/hydrogen antiporter